MLKLRLKLYVTGVTQRSERAIANIRKICEAELGGEFELDVIDVLEHPQSAEAEKILATPTLIREFPRPSRRIVGDLSETEKVFLGLDLRVCPQLATVEAAIACSATGKEI
jgi:circadian clock protein KaiB